MQSSVAVTAPPVIFQTGTAGSSTVYTNGTTARANAVAPAPTPTYYPDNYNMLSGNWWNSNYAYRRKVIVNNNVASTLSAGYSVLLTLDTASLVSAGKMLSTGYDLRILYWNGSSSSWLELDRVVEDMNTMSTTVWFKTQVSIGASGSDSNYYMYYGFSNAGSPPTDKNKVYSFYDDFSGGTLDTGKWTVVSGTPTIESGELDLADSVELKTVATFDRGYVWEQDVKAQADGTQVRVNIVYTDASNNYHAHLDTNGLRLHTSADVQLGASASYVRPSTHLLRLTVTSNTLRAELINKGDSSVVWDSGTVTDSSQTGTKPVGFRNSFATGIIHFHHDNLKIRSYVSPEPSVSLSSEELSYHLSGTVPTSVQNVDSDYFVVRSAGSANSTTEYNPSGYNLNGSTTLVSGTTSDLVSNNGVYMTFRSYASATSAQALYTHQETTTIGGTGYNLLGFSSADAAGTTLQASAGTTGRKLMGKFVWQLTGVSSIPASTWTSYYRAYGESSVAAHGDVDISIRMSNDTARTTIATNVADSGAIGTTWSTVSGTYSWSAYTIVDQTDYLEIDCYIEVTTLSTDASVYLRIDDSALATNLQTRAANIYLPSEYTSEVEFTGSSNTETWNQLMWSTDTAWTTGSLAVTVQVYNYTSGGYPTSGDGYVSYTSSSTANTDETRTQIITANPTHFRNESSNWKIRVTGVKTTTTQFDFKADWIEFKPTHYTEYTVSTEFLLSGMTTNTPTRLNFTVASEYDITSVNATIQVWNYSSSAYVTSGEGYSTYTSTGTNVTINLNITTNPQFYVSNGNAKIKITGAKTTTSQYQQQVNQVSLVYVYDASPTYNYLLGMTENHGTNWKVRLRAYDQSNVGRLSNCSIYIYDGSNSTQIVILNGVYNQQTGPWYDLSASDIEYIWMHVEASSTGTSYVYVYLEILVPGITTYAQYIVDFAIT